MLWARTKYHHWLKQHVQRKWARLNVPCVVRTLSASRYAHKMNTRTLLMKPALSAFHSVVDATCLTSLPWISRVSIPALTVLELQALQLSTVSWWVTVLANLDSIMMRQPLTACLVMLDVPSVSVPCTLSAWHVPQARFSIPLPTASTIVKILSLLVMVNTATSMPWKA